MAAKVATNIESNVKIDIDVTPVESAAKLASICSQLDQLSSNPFLQCSWMIPWIETYCDSDLRLQFLVAKTTAGELVGFAPLVFRNSLKRGQHFSFVGSGKACADYMTFPTKQGFEQKVAAAFANWFIENERWWDRIELDGATDNDKLLNLFAEQMEKSECQVDRITTLSSWRMQLPDSWDQVLGSLSKNSRKKYRRLERAIADKAQLHKAVDNPTLNQGLKILESLHTARWNSLGEAGCFAHQGFRKFLCRMSRQKLRDRSLSLIWLTLDGKPFAADIGFHTEDGTFTYQGGISPEHLGLEPGRAILKCQIESAIEHGSSFIDFLRGDEPYKSRFKAEEIDNNRLEIIGRKPRARIIQSMLQTGRAMKSLLELFD